MIDVRRVLEGVVIASASASAMAASMLRLFVDFIPFSQASTTYPA